MLSSSEDNRELPQRISLRSLLRLSMADLSAVLIVGPMLGAGLAVGLWGIDRGLGYSARGDAWYQGSPTSSVLAFLLILGGCTFLAALLAWIQSPGVDGTGSSTFRPLGPFVIILGFIVASNRIPGGTVRLATRASFMLLTLAVACVALSKLRLRYGRRGG